jgi:hypothetical protein
MLKGIKKPQHKSDRKTVFLSFLDAREDDMEEMRRLFEDAGISDHYRFIMTAKPIQVTSESDALEILNELVGENRQNRDDKIIRSLHLLEIAVNQLRMMHSTSDTNIHEVANMVTALASNIVSTIPSVPVPGYTPRLSLEGQQIDGTLASLSNVTPKEGEEY